MTYAYALIVVLIILAIYLLVNANRKQRDVGLPAGRVIYTDTRGWGRVEKPLYDPQTGLTGRPDYIVQQDDRWIPVEVKSTWSPPVPYDSHLFQLAAYCLLVERVYGVRPPYGILRYRNRTLQIEYTPQLEADLREMMEEMRAQERKGEPQRSHQDSARCARCGYREQCSQKI